MPAGINLLRSGFIKTIINFADTPMLINFNGVMSKLIYSNCTENTKGGPLEFEGDQLQRWWTFSLLLVSMERI